MKVSIITAVFNSATAIESCIVSVRSQTYADIEHVIVDGGSTDGTLDIINRYKDDRVKVISEPDDGLYDAMNKGIRCSTGDIIGILNSDDFYSCESVIEDVVNVISESNADSCYGDAIYVKKGNVNKIVRYWKSKQFSLSKFKLGWMPQHGTFYARKDVYMKYGLFRNEFPIAADYELILRFLYKHRISTIYLPKILLTIRTGGVSRAGFFNTSKMFIDNYKACKLNGLKPALAACFLKRLLKIPQYIIKP